MANYLWAIPLLPLLGAILNGFGALSGKLSRGAVNFIACASVFASFLVASATFAELWGLVHNATEGSTVALTSTAFTWIQAGTFKADAALMIDPLSGFMIMVITGIGFLIHLYSVGYMAEEPSYARYFAYLNLFTFSMLILVMGENALMMFVGWEGVGVCSYLLIGFWFTNVAYANAGMKAFVVNRIGDFGFVLGLFLLYWTLESMGVAPTVSFPELRTALTANPLPAGIATAVCLLLFVGATGKSAQIPLYIWLPDAMAGPTPVSALIHAATMVTAGVYMIIRLNFLFIQSPTAMTVIAVVGALTAFLAATIGMTQNDIKKVLAYSTVSQLGYMFLAVGVGAWTAGFFHLVTHAFFKACLFLGSGSVIHGMHHEQDMRKMGGLRKYMPVTFATFAIATGAINGLFLFSGFMSKDEILAKVLMADHSITLVPSTLLYAVGVTGALFTTFYMTRLVCMTFLGEHRGAGAAHGHDAHAAAGHDAHDHGAHGHDAHDHSAHGHDAHDHGAHGHDDHAKDAHAGHGHAHVPHESPWTMTVPLVVLAALSLFGGLLNVPHILGGHEWLHHWLSSVIVKEPTWHHLEVSTEWTLIVVLQALIFTLMGMAYTIYVKRGAIPSLNAELEGGLLYRLSVNKYYVDEIYQAVVVKPLVSVSRAVLWLVVDAKLIDGAVNGVGRLVQSGSQRLGHLQNGVINAYAFSVVLGSVLILGYLATR